MDVYEEIHHIAVAIKQTSNTELYQQLIDLSAHALQMQLEVTRLTLESASLQKETEKRIERHSELYITLKDDADKTLYCTHCWDWEHQLVQVKRYNSGSFKCAHCSNNGIYDMKKWNS